MKGDAAPQRLGCSEHPVGGRLAEVREQGIVVDDNDITIAGHPSEYMPGYSVAKTLAGHGLDKRFVTLQTPDIAVGKPAPDMMLRAMAETGAG